MPTAFCPPCFLFDNGSLRAASTRSLRRLAAELAPVVGAPVRAVSLLHSSAVPADELDGAPAGLLEPALEDFLAAGGREAVALPLFFGPSAALTEYAPARLAALQAKFPAARLRLARWLVDAGRSDDRRIAGALADAVRAVIAREGLERPPVLLADHGSPKPAVTAVREHLGRQLRVCLGNAVAAVGTASMERREGPAYDFNEPLLVRALRTPPFADGDVVVALQFLSPGRHAGPDGDIARICTEARAERPGLRTHPTEPLASHPALCEVLAERYREALETG